GAAPAPVRGVAAHPGPRGDRRVAGPAGLALPGAERAPQRGVPLPPRPAPAHARRLGPGGARRPGQRRRSPGLPLPEHGHPQAAGLSEARAGLEPPWTPETTPGLPDTDQPSRAD